MKKIIKQDGTRRVFILEDGTEISFDKQKETTEKEYEKPKKKKGFFEKKKINKPVNDFNNDDFDDIGQD